MYSPESFRERDVARLFDLIDAHPFGMLVVPGDDGAPEIAHVPFVLDRGVGAFGRLRFHVARANPVWRAATALRPVVAVFRGPDAYVSASWYEHPREQVPTWNYVVVHAHGRVAASMSKEETRRLVADLAAVHESGSPTPWRVDDADAALVDRLLDEIVGLSFDVARLDGKFKLSQNRSDEDRRRVKKALAARGGPVDIAMVRWME
jgi:transcriptional regulator